MDYILKNDRIIITSKDEFCPKNILECGQIFSYENDGEKYTVYSSNYKAQIIPTNSGYEIITKNPSYFVKFFDLDTNYKEIEEKLLKNFPFMKDALEYGKGIRILKQDYFETIISFIISSNNNIKRIKKILFAIREKCGKKIDDYYAFPSPQELSLLSEEDFKALGAGYRAKYLFEACRTLSNMDLTNLESLPTSELNYSLMQIKGVGQKVSDCIMLFAYSRQDVFPVDTWIEKVYLKYFEKQTDRKLIRENLIKTFKDLSGYAQQYLFYLQRENN